jgi:hypothetical protein
LRASGGDGGCKLGSQCGGTCLGLHGTSLQGHNLIGERFQLRGSLSSILISAAGAHPLLEQLLHLRLRLRTRSALRRQFCAQHVQLSQQTRFLRTLDLVLLNNFSRRSLNVPERRHLAFQRVHTALQLTQLLRARIQRRGHLREASLQPCELCL